MKNSGLNAEKTEAREYQTPSSGIFFKADRVLCEKTTAFQRVEIIDNAAFGRVLLLDGLVQTTEMDEFNYHEMLVHPACSSHPAPRHVLIIGGGDGGALGEVLKHPVEKAVLVEIDSGVVEACREFFPWLEHALTDPRSELVIGDGNAFIRETALRFDVVLVDSSDPVGPSTVLHEEEFYTGLKKILNPGGVIAAQAGSPVLHLEALASKSLFLKKLFRYSRYYLGPVPTYPVGTWCYHFLSDAVDPLDGRNLRIPAGLRYYNAEIHTAAFALPNSLRCLALEKTIAR